jgi:hypothetical protein
VGTGVGVGVGEGVVGEGEAVGAAVAVGVELGTGAGVEVPKVSTIRIIGIGVPLHAAKSTFPSDNINGPIPFTVPFMAATAANASSCVPVPIILFPPEAI